MKAEEWAEAVKGLAAKRDLRYEPVGGLNPVNGPVALCPGGTNRITGQLATEFWGASCDSDEHEEGGLFSKTVLPRSILAKAHMPDLAKVVPMFNVESIERDERVEQLASRRKVEFESIDFNRRFLATVPARPRSDRPARAVQPRLSRLGGADPERVRVRDHRQPALLHLAAAGAQRRRVRDRARHRPAACSCGCATRWRSQGEHTYQPGPWHAGLEPFPNNT